MVIKKYTITEIYKLVATHKIKTMPQLEKILNQCGISWDRYSKYARKMDAEIHKEKKYKLPNGVIIPVDYNFNISILNNLNSIPGRYVNMTCAGHINSQAFVRFVIKRKFKSTKLPKVGGMSLKMDNGVLVIHRTEEGYAPISWWNKVIEIVKEL